MKTAIRRMVWIVSVVVMLAPISEALGQDPPSAGKLKLVRAVICESIEGYAPVNPAVVFSIDSGRVSCFTEFNPVPKQTHIHHKWFRRDSLVTVKRLTINPPRWSSFTSVHLRDTDKGPWRVEISDENNKPMHTLRFSITD